MTKIALNKSSLNEQKKQLKTFNRYLPALELKREQLMLELKKARAQVEEKKRQIDKMKEFVAEQLPMLAAETINLDDLLKINNVEYDVENRLGLKLPTLKSIDVSIVEYSFLAKPHWVDNLVKRLQQMVQLLVELQLLEHRAELLADSLRTTTQRVNLFSNVLIPKTGENIKKIRLFLDDQERAAVVRSKISKAKAQAKNAQASAGRAAL
ncbi:V-type sodium ATPase subunit D [BD1-7 clade bacterium]|uniref:V-type sodium ATPase subunit D n=1 Tax=BD1-7 clade bacterium TaxID=2029982 RepID=A0A5S9R0B5_9GAMM|nr:V-type sodium ATPase subunit D [BD1-7 clade bacterium]